MADKCKLCVKTVSSRSSKVKCVDCEQVFHGACVQMSKEDIEFIESSKEIWRCDNCRMDRRKSMQVQSELSSDVPNIGDVLKLLYEMRHESKEQTRSLEAELGKSLELCHQTIEDLKQTISMHSKSLDKYKGLFENLCVENKKLQSRILELELKQDETDQYSRLNSIEINGIPEQANENVFDLVKKVGSSLDMDVTEDMVDTCHRLGPKQVNEERPRGIIVKFTRRTVKEEILKKRRIKRNLNTSDIGCSSPAKVIYMNESLTPARRRVFNAVRALKQEKGFTFVWIRNGKILVRPSEGDKVTAVTNMSDLEKLRRL